MDIDGSIIFILQYLDMCNIMMIIVITVINEVKNSLVPNPSTATVKELMTMQSVYYSYIEHKLGRSAL